MRTLLKTVILAAAFVTLACDPGMTIRQTDAVNPITDPTLTIHVKTTHPLIGENWYAPGGATATNLSDKAIMVMSVELIANGTTYANKPPGTSNYPLTIASGKTEALPIWFDLDASVKRTFEKTAELRVHYRIGGKGLISSAFIMGGPLDTNVLKHPAALRWLWRPGEGVPLSDSVFLIREQCWPTFPVIEDDSRATPSYRQVHLAI